MRQVKITDATNELLMSQAKGELLKGWNIKSLDGHWIMQIDSDVEAALESRGCNLDDPMSIESVIDEVFKEYHLGESLRRVKAYIKEQFDEFGDSPWLEGWICGYTDPDHTSNDELRDELFSWLHKLRKNIR